MSRLFTCSRCGCQRTAADLNGINLTASGWDDDSKAYCKRVAECKSAEAGETLDWLFDALDAEDAA